MKNRYIMHGYNNTNEYNYTNLWVSSRIISWQDVSRAKNELLKFIEGMSLQIACWFEEIESHPQPHRPELFRLLNVAMPGDIILVEQVDRIIRLNTYD